MHTDPPITPATPLPTEAQRVVGRVISVGGAQAVVRLSADAMAEDAGTSLTVGSVVGIGNRRSLVVAVLCDVTQTDDDTAATARLDLLGEIVTNSTGASQFERGVSVYPPIGAEVVPIGSQMLCLIFNAGSEDTISVGHLQQDTSVEACLDIDALVRKHFAVLGSTGAGKSSAAALILRDIMAACPDLRILLIDPHNEYAKCFGTAAHIVRPGTLRLPFWLFNFDEFVEIVFGRHTDVQDEISLLGELIPLAKNTLARASATTTSIYRTAEPDGGRYSVDTPVPYRMDDLIALAEGRMGKLENSAFASRYQRLIMRLNTARRNPRYAFIFDDPQVGSDPMVDILCDLFRLRQDGGQISVVQLAGFPAETFDAIVSVLFRLAFEFGLWSDGARPLLIACEEAHHYGHADRTRGFQPAREALARIAKEGRKYGVFLGLVTQRPAELDPTLISQCSTVFAMRMGNEADQNIVRAAVSDPSNRLIGFLPSLGTREAVAFGAGVPVAMRLRFRELPEDSIPRSEAVWGGGFAEQNALDEPFVASVVARWRGTAASNKPVRTATPGLESVLLTPQVH
jgi:hypothetical protein